MTPPICDACTTHTHSPDASGRCVGKATIEIPTSGAPILKETRCSCDCRHAPVPVGTKDADTQLEVAFAG